jgi:hypothetical protein
MYPVDVVGDPKVRATLLSMQGAPVRRRVSESGIRSMWGRLTGARAKSDAPAQSIIHRMINRDQTRECVPSAREVLESGVLLSELVAAGVSSQQMRAAGIGRLEALEMGMEEEIVHGRAPDGDSSDLRF